MTNTLKTLFSILATTAILALFWACDLPPSFSDSHKDSSINYIQAYPLAPPPAANADTSLEAYPLGMSASQGNGWDWSWRGTEATGNDFEYMSMEPVASVLATVSLETHTLPAGTPAWRLELKNLFRNGSFDETMYNGTEADWNPGFFTRSETGALDLNEFVILENLDISNVATIKEILHKKVLNIGFTNKGFNGNVLFHMDQLLLDAPEPSFGYLVRFIGFSNEPIPVLSSINLDNAVNFSPTDANTGSYFLSEQFFDFGAAGTRWSIGGSGAPSVKIDEFRVIRGDIQADLWLRLLLTPKETNPELVTGYYEFSVWVRSPEGAYAFDDPGRAASPNTPYASRSVTLSLRQVSSTDGSKPGKAEMHTVTEEWTRVSIRPPNLQSFDKDSVIPVLELSISPTDLINQDKTDAGAVLIANPSLNYFY